MYGSWTMSMSNYIDNAGPNGEGTFLAQAFIQDAARSPKQKKFVTDFLKEYKPDDDRIPSAMSAAQGYDSVYLLAAAIKQANSTDGTAIRDALCSLSGSIEGVSTTYNNPFSKEDHIALKREAGQLGVVQKSRIVPASL